MSVITSVKVKHCVNGGGVNNGQIGRQIHFLCVILMIIKRTHSILGGIMDTG